MNKRVWTMLGLSLALAGVALAQSRPEPNAYINRSVANEKELLKQVERDGAVMDRYCRHFGMTKDEVWDMIYGLKLARLDRDVEMTMYAVPGSGAIRGKKVKLKKGTKVLVDSKGNPIMKLSCGNPLTLGEKKVTTPPAPASSTVAEAPPEMQTMIEPPAPDVVVEMTPPRVPALPVAQVDPGFVVPPPVQPVEPLPMPKQKVIPPYWLFLPPLAFALPRHHSDDPPPIPDPATIVTVATGISMLIARKARKKSS